MHESASKLRLHARSRGLGADRFVAVCRREDAPPDDTSEDLDWLSGARLGNEGACEGRGASGLDPHEGKGRPVTSPRGPAGPAGPESWKGGATWEGAEGGRLFALDSKGGGDSEGELRSAAAVGDLTRTERLAEVGPRWG